MAKTAMTELQQQIEEVRREAFAAGYAVAMQAIRDLASRPATSAEATVRPRRRGAGRTQPATTPARRRKVGARQGAARRRRSAGRPQRGTNAQSIEEVLRAATPRALRPAEIRKALQDKGLQIAFTSIRHVLSQLEARNAAEQVGNSKTWRYRAET